MSTIPNKSFNDEELMFLNRIGFLCMIRHGASLNFNQFIQILTEFQCGDMNQISELIIEIILEGRPDQKIIQIEMFTNFILSSIPQDTLNKTTPQKVLHHLFNDHKSEEVCEQFISVTDLRKKIRTCEGVQKELL